MKYTEMSKEELAAEKASLNKEYAVLKSEGLQLNMARGVLSAKQLDLTQEMLGVLRTPEDCVTEAGTDCRNYGLLDGIPEAKRLFAQMLEVSEDELIVGGNSSLNMMYDALARNMIYGTEDGGEPWAKQGEIKFLCPVPGYDRHFAICESLGIKMINVPLYADGPDMDVIEKLVTSDASIKGIWCVPKYSNPTGAVYSDECVRRFAALRPAAKDFRIMWDNAYIVHALYGDAAKQHNIFEEAKKYGNENMIYEFASTSKISFPGSGVAVVASSKTNIDMIKKRMSVQTIGADKLNQMRHVRYFKSFDGILAQMKRHAEIIAPKFRLVDELLTRELDGKGIASWSNPEGGYFISLNVLPGCAAAVYAKMSDLGVKLTPSGATYPYHNDPDDSNLRIAPTFPPIEELEKATEALCLCVKLAAVEKLIG